MPVLPKTIVTLSPLFIIGLMGLTVSNSDDEKLISWFSFAITGTVTVTSSLLVEPSEEPPVCLET